MSFPSLGSSYDQDTWELMLYIGGREYVYSQVSPFHHTQFRKKAKRNRGRAMAWIRKNFKMKGGVA